MKCAMIVNLHAISVYRHIGIDFIVHKNIYNKTNITAMCTHFIDLKKIKSGLRSLHKSKTIQFVNKNDQIQIFVISYSKHRREMQEVRTHDIQLLIVLLKIQFRYLRKVIIFFFFKALFFNQTIKTNIVVGWDWEVTEIMMNFVL